MKKEVKRSTIGGQGVLDGVMMRSPKKGALAVRKKDGSIAVKEWEIEQKKGWFLRLPIVRGVVNFVDMLFSGTKVLMDAATMAEEGTEEFEPSKFERFVAGKTGKKAEDVMMFFAVFIAIIMAIALFFLLPTFLTSLLKGAIQSPLLLNLVDGVVRIVILIAYMLCCSLMKEIKDVYRYHGAEHKTVSCYEAGEQLTVEHVRGYSTLHPRCGTSYLLLVMVVTVLIYSFFGWSDNPFLRLGLRLLMLPVIAGVAYEALKLLAKSDNLVARVLRWPGMQLQRLTTAKPTDEMIEIAILAFETALGEKTEEQLAALREQFTHLAPKAQEGEEAGETAQKEEQVGAEPSKRAGSVSGEEAAAKQCPAEEPGVLPKEQGEDARAEPSPLERA